MAVMMVNEDGRLRPSQASGTAKALSVLRVDQSDPL